MTLDTLFPVDVEYGRYEEKRVEDILSSTDTVSGIDPASFFPMLGKAITWDDLDDNEISELMIWDKASAQDFRFIEGLTE